MARDFLMCIKRYLCLKLQCERNFIGGDLIYG